MPKQKIFPSVSEYKNTTFLKEKNFFLKIQPNRHARTGHRKAFSFTKTKT